MCVCSVCIVMLICYNYKTLGAQQRRTHNQPQAERTQLFPSVVCQAKRFSVLLFSCVAGFLFGPFCDSMVRMQTSKVGRIVMRSNNHQNAADNLYMSLCVRHQCRVLQSPRTVLWIANGTTRLSCKHTRTHIPVCFISPSGRWTTRTMIEAGQSSTGYGPIVGHI